MRIIFFLIALTYFNTAFSQTKTIADYSVEMKAVVMDSSDNIIAEGIKQIIVAGKKARIDFRSEKTIQSTVIDYVSNTAFILRETGADKYMRRLNANDWKQENLRFTSLNYQISDSDKRILDYNCKKAVAQLSDGTQITAYFYPGFNVISSENNFQFAKIPGLVLEYEITGTNSKVHFIATSLSFDPAPASKFNPPTSGYRLIEKK